MTTKLVLVLLFLWCPAGRALSRRALLNSGGLTAAPLPRVSEELPQSNCEDDLSEIERLTQIDRVAIEYQKIDPLHLRVETIFRRPEELQRYPAEYLPDRWIRF